MVRTHYYCEPCYRYFTSHEALESHWTSSGYHIWCQRCNGFFKFQSALDDHLENSRSHGICEDHSLAFKTFDELHNHCCERNNDVYCKICDEHFVEVIALRIVSPWLYLPTVFVVNFGTHSSAYRRISNVGGVMTPSINIPLSSHT